MKFPISRKLIGAAVLVVLLMMSIASDALGQGRGRRVGRGLDKKCGKFVNCHDARDGRLDGRGPRRNNTLLGDRIRRVRRNRDRDNDDRFERNRRWRRIRNHRIRR
jgi:hypothetical protein